MKSINAILAVIVFTTATTIIPAEAQVGKYLSGAHYNLIIVGVPKDKEVPAMDNGGRHTIFVPLDSGDDVSRKVKIYYERNADDPTKFNVKDGNATDDNQAIIQVPYEFCQDGVGPCENLLGFKVYAFGLGKPGGSAGLLVDCIYSDDLVDGGGLTGEECEDTVEMGDITITRTRGKPKKENITDLFKVSGCLDSNLSGVCDVGDVEFNDVWIFNLQDLMEYYWDYDNNGLKVMQVRFYEKRSGCIGTAGDCPDS